MLTKLIFNKDSNIKMITYKSRLLINARKRLADFKTIHPNFIRVSGVQNT